MKIVVTRKILGPAVDLLQQQGYEVVVNPEDRVLSPEELQKLVSGADAILSLLTNKIDAAVLDAAGKQLKIVANYAVGFDNVDLEAAKARNVYVTNTPDVLTEAVAEHTIALLLAVARKIVQADKYVREGKYHQWEPDLFVGTELKGKTLGVVGLGRIGTTVAKMAHFGLGMKICYHTHKVEEELDKEINSCFYDNLESLLSNVDVVTVHVPLTAETTHMIGKKELSAMKKTAILLNAARGPIVDETALIQALKEGWIAGAGLDVFEEEGVGTNINPELLALTNAVLTPHIASATMEARSEMSRLAAENIIAALSGKVPENLVK